MANTTITPNTGKLKLSFATAVIATAGALSLQGSAPAVTQHGTNTTIAPATVALIISHAAFNPSIKPNSGSLNFVGLAPSVANGSVNVTITPSRGSLLLELPASIIQPGTATLGFAGFMPTQTLGLPAVPVGALSFFGAAPTLGFTHVITPNSGALILAGQPPNVGTLGNIIVPTGAPIALTGFAPTLKQTTEIHHAALTLAGFAPLINSTGNTLIRTRTGALNFVGAIPGVVTNGDFNVGWTFDNLNIAFSDPDYTMDGAYTPPPGWPLPSTITNLPVRGAWTIPGGTQAIWVIGSGCFLMTVATPATYNAQATFNLKRVGTLNTSANPVCIRDNGAGGTVVIVDGPYGYYYTFSTAGLAASGGAVGDFVQITDPNFLGADRVAFIDGWWIFNVPGTQEFYTPDATYSLTFNGTNFALTDGATDLLVTLYENKEELWLVCEKHTEVWYDAGGQFFAFQRLVSTMLQVGCSAKNSIARFNSEDEDGLIWLALSERGQNVVIKISGFTATVVSTPAINDAIASYTIISDAIGYTYQEDGHEFYVLTFPSAQNEWGGIGATWVYDGSTDMWHQRLAFEPYSGLWYRHRSNCFLNFQNQRLVGDFQNGSIYRMDRSVYTDNGWPLVAWRRSPHIWDGGARERVFMASLQIEFKPGTGNTYRPGFNPEAVLTISRDGGTTFGQELRRHIGKLGTFLTRAIWRRLSFSRDAVVDVKVYDPVNRDIVGATLKKGENG